MVLTWISIQLHCEPMSLPKLDLALAWALWSWLVLGGFVILLRWIAYVYFLLCILMVKYVILDPCTLILEYLISSFYWLLKYGLHCSIDFIARVYRICLCKLIVATALYWWYWWIVGMKPWWSNQRNLCKGWSIYFSQ